jgi:uncharacterized protein YecT (DUF1311 family)
MRILIGLLALLIAIGAAGSHAHAADPNCDNAHDEAAIDRCMASARNRTDRELNQVYQALMAKVSDRGKRQLRDAERAWITYRDRQCAFDTAGSIGGSIHDAMVANCHDRITTAHIAELKAQLNCREGDLACGRQ